MLASVMFGLAEIEQEYRRERQAAGIAVAKRNGVYRGRVKGTTKAQPTRALLLRTRGFSAPEIANALGISPRTVFRYLTEKLPRGQHASVARRGR
jgi:DNA invertase Pin-like site-specific DNA recombinase